MERRARGADERAVDDTSEVQPSRKAVTAGRSPAVRYHFNGMQSWSVTDAGEVRNVYV